MMGWKSWGLRVVTGQQRGPAASVLRGILTAASWGYGLGVQVAHGWYAARLRRPARLSCPVVSVGNLTWGGTGKTPLTAHLAQALHARGVRVAILVRGYGADEPQVLRRLAPDVPVFVHVDRVVAGRRAIREGARLLLLDDGFQHWRLHRDLDLVLLDAQAPFGNGRLIPRGPLREPVTALKRAGVVVITRCDEPGADIGQVMATVRALHPQAWMTTARYQAQHLERWPSGVTQPLSVLRNLRVGVLSGIGDPLAFEGFVARMGALPALTWQFPDHHGYRIDELRAVSSACQRAGVSWLVTTLKDAVRLPQATAWAGRLSIAVLHVTMDVSDEGELLQRILGLLGR